MRSWKLSIPVLVIGLAMSSASAAPSVEITSKSTVAGVTYVTGTAEFPPITEPEELIGDTVRWDPSGGDLPPEVATALGVGLTGALIQRIDGGLRFIWQTDGLPPTVPPEGVRYTWAFAVGQQTFQLQAKLTNMASSTLAEEPVEHVIQARDQKQFFQLRGACETSYLGTPIAGCYHLAFLNGGFDYDKDQVFIDMPYQTRDRIGRIVAPDFKPGAVIAENQTAGMSIAASVQAFVSNTLTSGYINGWGVYRTAPSVALATGSNPSQAPFALYSTPADFDGTNFSGAINGTTGSEIVFARACDGATCAYDTL
ncbi:MAG: hypothetical protein ACLGH3_04965 [Actinomycetota bacterium]